MTHVYCILIYVPWQYVGKLCAKMSTKTFIIFILFANHHCFIIPAPTALKRPIYTPFLDQSSLWSGSWTHSVFGGTVWFRQIEFGSAVQLLNCSNPSIITYLYHKKYLITAHLDFVILWCFQEIFLCSSPREGALLNLVLRLFLSVPKSLLAATSTLSLVNVFDCQLESKLI